MSSARRALVPFCLLMLALTAGTAASDSDWPMFGHDARHTSAASVSAPLPDRIVLWDNDDPVAGLGVAQGDFTANIEFTNGSSPEDITDCHLVYSVGKFLYVVDATSGETMWRLDVTESDGNASDDDEVATAPLVADVDGDGTTDIVFGTNDGKGEGMLFAYSPRIEYDGRGYDYSANNHDPPERLWRKALLGPINHSNPVLTYVADIGDVIAIGAGDRVFLLEAADRNQVWSVQLRGGDVSTPTAVPSGTTNNIAVSSVDWDAHRVTFYILDDKTGEVRVSLNDTWSGDYLGSGDVLPSPVVAELDGNTSNGREVIFVTPFRGSENNGIVHAYHADGSLYWETAGSDISGQIEATPAVADVDDDGDPEIAVIAWDIATGDYYVNISLLNGRNGEALWQRDMDLDAAHPGDDARAVCSPVLLDVDGDGELDLLGAVYRTLFALDGADGSTIWTQDLPFRLWAQPAVFNLNDDRFSEILAGSLMLVQEIAELHPVDVEIEPDVLEEGARVWINATIENSGGKDADDVRVWLMVEGETVQARYVDLGAGGGRRWPQFTWRPSALGTYNITISVDRENEVDEADESNNNLTTTVVVRQVLYVNITPDQMRIDHDETANLTVNVTNAGSGPLTVNLSAHGPAGWTLDLPNESIELGPGENSTVNLTVGPGPETVSAWYNVTVSGTTEHLLRNSTVLMFVRPYHGLRFEGNVTGGIPSNQTRNFTLVLLNDGNTPDNATISVSAPGGWTAEPQDGVVTVAPFSGREIRVNVTSPDAEHGSAVITVTADYPNGSVSASLNITIQVPDFLAEAIHFYRADGERVGPGTSKHCIALASTVVSLRARSIGEIGGWAPVAVIVNGTEMARREAFIDLDVTTTVNLTVELPGDSTVTVSIDPDDEVREDRESNNHISIEIDTIPRDTNASFVLSGTVQDPEGGQAAEAWVEMTIVRTGQQVTFRADGEGRFTLDLASIDAILPYREGEVIELRASDGINASREPVVITAYSEDERWQGTVDLAFSEFYFYMEHLDPDTRVGETGGEVNFTFRVVNVDPEENNISFEYIERANWEQEILRDGAPVSSVTVPGNGSVDLTLHLTISEAVRSRDDPDDPYRFKITATSERNPDLVESIYFSVLVPHRTVLDFDDIAVSKAYLPNGTLVPSVFDCRNRGNNDEPIEVSAGSDLPGNWSLTLVLGGVHGSTTFHRDDQIRWTIPYGGGLTWEITPGIVPDTPRGNYTINLTVEGRNGTYNITVPVQVLAIDLVVESIRVEGGERAQVGTDTNIVVTIVNRENLGTGLLAVLNDTTENVTAEETLTIAGYGQILWTVPWRPRVAGQHSLNVVVTPLDGAQETGGGNDLTVIITVREDRPDLTVTDWGQEGDAVVGRELRITATIRNVGALASSRFVDVVLMDGESRQILFTEQIGMLGVGEETPVDLYWIPNRSGSISLVIVVDPGDDLTESSETNNEMNILVLVDPAPERGGQNILPLIILTGAVLFLALLFGRRHIRLPSIRAIQRGNEPSPGDVESEGEGEMTAEGTGADEGVEIVIVEDD